MKEILDFNNMKKIGWYLPKYLSYLKNNQVYQLAVYLQTLSNKTTNYCNE